MTALAVPSDSSLERPESNEKEEDTDYGSDFSPEEEQIMERLLASKTDIEDNPIASGFEKNDTQHKLRVPNVSGTNKSTMHEAASAAERSTAHRYKTTQYPES